MAVIDPVTVTRGITYLYRWWVQEELKIVPEAYIRRAGQATLVCPEWAIVASASSVECKDIDALVSDLNRPVYTFCPNLAANLSGFDLATQSPRQLNDSLHAVALILQKHQRLLAQLGEENLEREEWWRTLDAGAFKIWRTRARRLLLYPTGRPIYGFSMADGVDARDFFFRSRSCREEGRVIKDGVYKMSEHALPTARKVRNLDLLFSDGKVLLLRLLPTGAGFRVFPRRVIGYEGSLD
jgi:hypothetical protein